MTTMSSPWGSELKFSVTTGRCPMLWTFRLTGHRENDDVVAIRDEPDRVGRRSAAVGDRGQPDNTIFTDSPPGSFRNVSHAFPPFLEWSLQPLNPAERYRGLRDDRG